MTNSRKPRSTDVTEGDHRAPARAMLRAVGMGDEDMDKAQIGVASSWNEITPCNLSLARLAKAAKPVRAAKVASVAPRVVLRAKAAVAVTGAARPARAVRPPAPLHRRAPREAGFF